MSQRGFSDVPKNEIRAVQNEANRLAAEIQRIRKELGFTQESLAEKLDVSLGTIRQIEQGVRMPSLPMLIRICRVLKLRIEIAQAN